MGPSLIPTVTGDITLEWHTDGIDLEVIVEPEGASSLLVEAPAFMRGERGF